MLPRYVLITPARNEEAFLEETIRSVTAQTARPEAWAIVSDGSTDRTDDIIRDHAARHPWIRYVRRQGDAARQFAGKARAFAAGHAVVRDVTHDIVGNVDADLSFGPDVMAFLMSRFAEDARLGVAGVPFVEGRGAAYDYRFTNIEHVSGACQLFRRECFETVGGYKPIEGGGIDWLAVTTARMKGWKTRTFIERLVIHHRQIGTGGNTRVGFLFRQGVKEFYLGNHPLWQVFRALYQMTHKPYVMGGLAIFSGYLVSFMRGVRREAPTEVIRFCRREQLQRLMALLKAKRTHGAIGPSG